MLAHVQLQLAWALQALEYAQDRVKSDLVSIACGTSYMRLSHLRHAVWHTNGPAQVSTVRCIGIIVAIC